jgi:hypothetical protein
MPIDGEVQTEALYRYVAMDFICSLQHQALRTFRAALAARDGRPSGDI